MTVLALIAVWLVIGFVLAVIVGRAAQLGR